MAITDIVVGQSMAAFTPIKFSLKLVELLYNDSLYSHIANTKYEGQIKDSGDRVRVRTAGRVSLSTYTKGMRLVRQELTPTSEELVIDQQKYFSFSVDDIDAIQNDINAISEYAANAKRDMSELIDADLLSYGRKNVFYANVVGTNYSTGTVSIAATTGVVTGAGTTFTAAMVGGILKVVGQSKGYYISAYSSTTSITVTDQGSTAYTGGALAGVAAGQDAFTIWGATHIAATKSTIYKNLVDVDTALNAQNVPRGNRFIVLNAQAEGLVRQAPEFIPAVQSAYDSVVGRGVIGTIAGLKVLSSQLVDGDNTTGWWFLAGDKEFLSFASQIMKVSVIPSSADPESFVSTCKGLLVYGRKVFEENRKRGAVLRATLS
jgi:hypothetical protein